MHYCILLQSTVKSFSAHFPSHRHFGGFAAFMNDLSSYFSKMPKMADPLPDMAAYKAPRS